MEVMRGYAAVVGEEAAAPLRPTEEPEQDAPVPEAPQPEPEPTEEAVAATSTGAHSVKPFFSWEALCCCWHRLL